MFKDILTDVVILIFLLGYLLYSYIESLIRSLVPSRNFYKDVKGDTVLVTGAAGGIGSHLASKFFDLGCTVICVDNNKEELAKLKDRLIKEKLSKSADDNNNNLTSFKRLHFFNVDISSLDEIKSVSGRIRQDIGRVDILINNAGIMNKGKLLTELSDQEIKTIFDVNILAHFWLIREFLPEMIKINKGHICNVASVCGLMGSYKLTDYCSTKFAVVGLTESIRSELNGLNLRNRIKATVVCPFHVQTKLFNGVEFSRLGWAGLSMAPERVADQIVDGILSNKDIVYIPRFQTCLFYLLKNLTSSKFTDQAMRWLELNGAMDKYKSKSQ